MDLIAILAILVGIIKIAIGAGIFYLLYWLIKRSKK